MDETLRAAVSNLEVDGGYQAVIRLADITWCKRLDTDAQGVPLGSWKSYPRARHADDGSSTGLRLLQVLSNALVHRAPEMLAPALELVLAKVPVEWATPATRPVRLMERNLFSMLDCLMDWPTSHRTRF